MVRLLTKKGSKQQANAPLLFVFWPRLAQYTGIREAIAMGLSECWFNGHSGGHRREGELGEVDVTAQENISIPQLFKLLCCVLLICLIRFGSSFVSVFFAPLRFLIPFYLPHSLISLSCGVTFDAVAQRTLLNHTSRHSSLTCRILLLFESHASWKGLLAKGILENHTRVPIICLAFGKTTLRDRL